MSNDTADKSTGLNFPLAFRMARNSLRHHLLVTIATILGVTIGMGVVSSILIVDFNTARPVIQQEKLSTELISNSNPSLDKQVKRKVLNPIALPIKSIKIIKQQDNQNQQLSNALPKLPSQKAQHPPSADRVSTAKGEEDYQVMRLAIRMASMFAFFVGAVIVFYTMRLSVAMRIKELALLLCLGEHRYNVALSIIVEAFILGFAGTFFGILVSFPCAHMLLDMGISTTGRLPLGQFAIPYVELSIMAAISLLIALLGVISPIRSIFRLQIAQVLQPRFITDEVRSASSHNSGVGWLIPPVLLASYLALRPFLESWLSVIYFFMLEAVFVISLVLTTIWLTRPFLRFSVRLIEIILRRMIPLETLLSIRRIRLSSQKYVFSIIGVILVFCMLSSIHAITRSLKHEINDWSDEALRPYAFFVRDNDKVANNKVIKQIEEQNQLHIFRFSAKSKGSFPIRLIHADDYNRYRKKYDLSPFTQNQVIFSKTLAARFGAKVGDTLQVKTENKTFDFFIVEITDAIGAFIDYEQYIDTKSYALFSNGHPLFQENLQLTLGDFVMIRSSVSDKSFFSYNYKETLSPFYRLHVSGRYRTAWRLKEIDKDFLIFDFILLMTVVLACIGIVNTLLIQVHARNKELSILKTLGINQLQMLRLLLVEGSIIGIVGGFFAVLLGIALGIISVSFLNHFTLFEYEYVGSVLAETSIFCLALFTCLISAIYPALTATRISTAESLQYE